MVRVSGVVVVVVGGAVEEYDVARKVRVATSTDFAVTRDIYPWSHSYHSTLNFPVFLASQQGQLHRWGRIGTPRKKRRWERWAAGRSKRISDPRALGIGFSSLCFLSVFSKCVLSLVRASLVFTCFIPLVLSQCAQFVGGGGAGCCHRARPSGRDGRQELDEIVYSLERV